MGSVHIEQSYQGMMNSEDVDRYQRDQVSSDGGDVFIETDIEVGNSIVLENYYAFDIVLDYRRGLGKTSSG